MYIMTCMVTSLQWCRVGLYTSMHKQILCQAQCFCLQAEHYDRTRQQQIDIGLLAPEEAQASAEQVQP